MENKLNKINKQIQVIRYEILLNWNNFCFKFNVKTLILPRRHEKS